MTALEIAFKSHHSDDDEVAPATREFDRRMRGSAAYRGGLFSNDGAGEFCAFLLLDSEEAARAGAPGRGRG